MSPRISVIIPVHDHADELVSTLRALSMQTLLPQEVIVVDDASSDRPEEVANAADLRSLVTKWIRLETNRGAPIARNTGFDVSTGEFVIFLDADASLRVDGLSLLSEALQAHPEASYAYSAFRFGGKTFHGQRFSPQALARGNFIHTSALIRRDAFPGFDPSIRKFQDWDLWIRIARAGGTGVFVPEVLLDIQARKTGGMSRWIPADAYRLPWQVVGWIPETVEKYHCARQVIQEKHAGWFAEMASQDKRQAPTLSLVGWLALGAFFAILSFAVIGTSLNALFMILFCLALIGVTIWRPTFGLGLLSFELLIGSKGGWLKVGSDAVNDGGIGIRIGFFAAFFVGWAVYLLRNKIFSRLSALLRERWLWPYLAMAVMLFCGLLRGWQQGNASVFIAGDANAWGYLLLLLPVVALSQQASQRFWIELRPALKAGIVALTVLTLVLFVLFGRVLPFPADALETIYLWIRQSGLGEITRTAYRVSRIFLQSQFLLLPAWLWLLVEGFFDRRPLAWRRWVSWILLGAAILVSFSRSFWLALAVASVAVALSAAWEGRKAFSWALVRRLFVRPALALGGSLTLLFSVASFSLVGVIGGRFVTNEPAVASRWDLLPIMREGIRLHPILGSGFGATLTYPTSDPRLVEKGMALYTTYAFEWGWLDAWYKLGIFGVLPLLIVLGSLSVRARNLVVSSRLFIWGSVLLLAVTHVFTPYLNHPIGIGLLIFLEIFLQKEKHLQMGSESDEGVV